MQIGDINNMKEKKFYAKKWFCILTLIFFAPVGIFLLWKYNHFSPKVSKILTVASIVFFVYALVTALPDDSSSDEPEVKTTSEAKKETQAPAETDSVTDAPADENAKSDKFLENIKKIIEGSIGEDETIKNITLEERILCIYVDISQTDPAPLTLEDLAISRTSSITDAILELNDYDDMWEMITIDFGNIGTITNNKNSIETNDYGRYFPSENFKLNSTNNVPKDTPKKETATLGESNALSAAKTYLQTMSFSKKGLKDQLKYEGYTDKEAKYGVNKCGANWKEQAAKKAKEYLDTMPFSKKDLINQLKYDGFTTEQANYGVKKAGY